MNNFYIILSIICIYLHLILQIRANFFNTTFVKKNVFEIVKKKDKIKVINTVWNNYYNIELKVTPSLGTSDLESKYDE